MAGCSVREPISPLSLRKARVLDLYLLLAVYSYVICMCIVLDTYVGMYIFATCLYRRARMHASKHATAST